MANKKVSQLSSKPSVLVTDLFPIADPSTGQLYKTTISDLGTAIGSGVSSVNGLVGAVVLDTDDIQELVSPTNKWFTDTRARAALSASSPLAYNSGTGVFSIPAATSSQNGYLTSTDWSTFNGKQAALSGTGFVKISGTTISYDNSTYALDSAVVHNTGTESVGGIKTFTSQAVFNNSFIIKNTNSGSVSYGGNTTIWTSDDSFNILVGTASSTTKSFSFIYGSNVQLTLPSSDGTLALVSNLSAYLPLTGGTLTGALSGTSISLSSSVTASALYVTGMTAGSGAIYHTGSRLTFANYNASGTLHFEVNGGNPALTLNSDKSATFENTARFNGGEIQIYSGTSIAYAGVDAGNSKVYFGTNTSGYGLSFQCGGGERLIIANSGAATFSSSVAINGETLTIGGTTNNAVINNIASVRINIDSDNSGTGESFIIGHNQTAIDNNNVLFKVQDNGNVGIGTTAPYNPGGSGQTSLEMSGTNYSTIYLSANSATVRGQIGADNLNGWVEVGSRTNHPFLLISNNTERMRITSGGNVGIGTTSPGSFPLAVQANSNAIGIGIIGRSDGYGEFHFRNNANSASYAYIQGQPGNSLAVVAGSSGGVYLANGGTSWTAISDERMKTDLMPIENATKKVGQLRSMTGRYKTDSQDKKRSFLIAQDVLEVLPEAVNLDTNSGMYGVQYTDVIPLLVASIKELKAELDTLKNK